MSRNLPALAAGLALCSSLTSAQSISPKWEDLTSAEFVKAVPAAAGVCLLPMGSLEKFGPSAPIGTNVYLVRIIALETAKREYAVVFPDYFVANTNDTSNLPGTVHYSVDLQLKMLDETVREMARNGCRKIILANGHTGNLPLINLYMAGLSAMPHDFAVYTSYISGFPVNNPERLPAAARVSRAGADGHGGEERVAALMAYYPNLVHTERAHDEPASAGHGAEDRNNPPPAGAMTELPTGYSGDAAGATAVRGHALVDYAVDSFARFIRSVKADTKTLVLQKQFQERFRNPLGAPAAK